MNRNRATGTEAAGSDLARALKSIVTVQSHRFPRTPSPPRRSGRALGERRRHPRQRSGADDRLSDHRGRERLARRRGRPGHPGACACHRCGDRLRAVQALGDLNCPALELGRSSEAKLGDSVTVAAGAGTKPVKAMIVGKHEFAGYWEYFLDEAIFTSPAHPFWGGAGLIDRAGRLIGIGSLHVEQLSERAAPRDINMIVPIDLLAPILDDLLSLSAGSTSRRARGLAFSRPKMAMRSSSRAWPTTGRPRRRESAAATFSPASAGLGSRASATFITRSGAGGPAGVEIPIEIVRDGRPIGVRVRSADRSSFLKRPRLQ